jgi:pentapeptide MXKDX repeat protein
VSSKGERQNARQGCMMGWLTVQGSAVDQGDAMGGDTMGGDTMSRCRLGRGRMGLDRMGGGAMGGAALGRGISMVEVT